MTFFAPSEEWLGEVVERVKKKGSVSLLTQMENLVYGHFVQSSNHSKPDWSIL